MPDDQGIAQAWKSFDDDKRTRLLGRMSPDQKTKLRKAIDEAGPHSLTDFTAKTDKTKGDGLFKMIGPDGAHRDIPYSNVMPAAGFGYKVTPLERERYARDRRAELLKTQPTISEPEYLKAMALPPANAPGPGVWDRFRGWVQKTTEPTNNYPKELPTANPVDPVTVEAGLNILKRVGRFGFGMADMVPQIYGAWEDAISADPQRSAKGETALLEAHPDAQLYNRAKEVRDDWRVSPKLAAENIVGDAAGMWLTDKAAQVPGKALRSEYLTQKIPHGMIDRIIKPTRGDITFGKDPAQAILDEKIVGKDARAIGDRVYEKLDEVGKLIDKEAKLPANAGKLVSMKDVLKPFDDAIAKASQPPANRALFKALIKAKEELAEEYAVRIKRGKPTLKSVGPANLMMSPDDALQFKRGIGDRISWNQDPIQGQLNQAYGKAYGVAKDALNNALGSEFAKLNDRYANLVGAAKAAERQVPVEARGAHWKLTDIVIGTHSIPLAAARMAARDRGALTRTARGLHGLPDNPLIPGTRTRIAVASGAATANLGGHGGSGGQDKKKEAPTAPQTPAAAAPSKPSAAHPGAAPSFADAISHEEGFGLPGKIPTLANNPGNLKLGNIGHGTMVTGDGQEITIFGSLAEGRAALDNQLNKIFDGRSSHYSPDMTLEQFGPIYSGGDAGYGARIAAALGVDPSTTLSQIAERRSATPASQALATAKAEGTARRPTAGPPIKMFKRVYSNPTGGDSIGTDDGVTFFDVETGQQVR